MTRQRQSTYRITDQDHVYTLGIDYGPEVRQLYTNGDYVLWYSKGYTAWSGVGETGYYGPTYYIMETWDEDGLRPGYRSYRKIKEKEATRSTWRQVRKDLIAEIDALVGG